jgi:hypothetical protein
MTEQRPYRRMRYLMPVFMESALVARGLMPAYEARPPYQRNDYIMWITDAARPRTQRKRLDQMLAELEQGDVYMKMAWRPGRSEA